MWRELQKSFAQIKDKPRLSSEEREISIINLLQIAPLSLQELKQLTQLSEPYLRSRLQVLAQKNKVVFLYPKRPSHPLQKYCLLEKIENEQV